MTNLLDRKDAYICGLLNLFAIAIIVDSESETVQYQYVCSTIEAPVEVYIEYDLDTNEPYFETKEGVRYYLSEFVRYREDEKSMLS